MSSSRSLPPPFQFLDYIESDPDLLWVGNANELSQYLSPLCLDERPY